MTLPKKERALCLFNVDVLRAKLTEASDVLDALAEDGDTDITAAVVAAKTTPSKSYENRQLPTPAHTPKSASTSTMASSLPRTPPDGWSIGALAKLPAVDVVRLAASVDPPPELAKPDVQIVAQQDAFFDTLRDRPANEQKQRLGERLFKVIKALGIPKASQKTIDLLDTEDLRSLCHLMMEQPEILREKASQLDTTINK